MYALRRLASAHLLMGAAFVAATAAQGQTAVTTYHSDQGRTGWNATETTLTAANAGALQLQQSVALDGQVDAQPLLVPGVNLGAAGVHDVVYVVTENDSVYGLDAASGAVLLQTSLGVPVPENALPGGCNNNDVTVGITATPVIDPAGATMYVMAYTYPRGVATYTLHALNITTLADRMAPSVVTAQQDLSNRSEYSFNAAVTRQRAALLLANGNVYAGFGSFCDSAPNRTRGWVMGWRAASLAPLGGDRLLNRRGKATFNEFLTAVWMSGFGLAADPAGSIYFATGNSDMSGKSWNAKFNLAESVVKLAPKLGAVQSYYTPTDPMWGQRMDDTDDGDVGSGGVMLLPAQPGAMPNLAIAAGKNTPILVLNRDNLGGRGNNQVATAPSGSCWCGPSYFTGPDGIGRVVSSTGQGVVVFSVQTSPSVALVHPVSPPGLATGQDAGFFTSVSSNGQTAGSAIVWAVSRPVDGNPATVQLYAFDPIAGTQLFQAPAGTWPNSNANANLVPTVANGRVYVASYKQLTIFGLGQPAKKVAVARPAAPVPPALAGAPHALTGIVTGTDHTGFTLRLRSGALRNVRLRDPNAALPAWLRAGAVTRVQGDYGNVGFVALSVVRAKAGVALWGADK